uniref:Uncharacterized protein n=1 Tax=Oryza rufipogon TaxID=4529 RepID=A0A0E0P4C5_ORYRU
MGSSRFGKSCFRPTRKPARAPWKPESGVTLHNNQDQLSATAKQNARTPQMELTKMINFKNSLRPHTGSISFPQKRRPRELPIA